MESKQFTIYKQSGYELHCSLFSNNNPNLIVLCHGGLGDRFEHGRFPDLAKKLVTNGIDALLFDFSGFGQNERTPISLFLLQTDLKDVWNWAKTQNYKKIGTLGLSLGGLISLLTPLSDRYYAIFWAPGFDLKNSISPMQKILGRIKFTISAKPIKMKNQGAGPDLLFGKQFMEEVLDLNIEKNLRELTIPTLIIQGMKDTTVNPEFIKMAFEKMPRDEIHVLKLIEGAPHDFRGKFADQFIENTLEFLLNFS